MLKRTALLLLMVAVFGNCDTSGDDPLDVSSIYGTWQLVEYLLDPGDGSGTFVPAQSAEEITLTRENTFRGTWNACGSSEGEGSPYEGRFELKDPQRFEILCESALRLPHLGYLEDGFLILSHGGCIEPCLYKFLKISDL